VVVSTIIKKKKGSDPLIRSSKGEPGGIKKRKRKKEAEFPGGACKGKKTQGKGRHNRRMGYPGTLPRNRIEVKIKTGKKGRKKLMSVLREKQGRTQLNC